MRWLAQAPLIQIAALAWWSPAMLAAQAASGSEIPVQRGVIVRPDTVTVGQSFEVVVRVRSARGAQIAFPVGPDSAGGVEAVDPVAVRGAPDSAAAERLAIYRLVAWDTGSRAPGLGDVVVTLRGVDRRVPLGDVRVYVRSVLPADTTRHVPKPARDIVPAVRPWWRWLVVGLLAFALVGLVVWWLLRRRRRAPATVSMVDALAYAEREFTRVDALGLLDAGERGRYVALIVEVLRHYFGTRIDGAQPSLTSAELLVFVQHHGAVPVDRLARVLAEADLIKFARRPVTTERAREIGREARAIVRDTDRAATAPVAKAA